MTPKEGLSSVTSLEPVEQLFAYVRSLVNREDLVSELWEEYLAISDRRLDERPFAYVKLYFAFENFIVANKPLVVKRLYTRETLRTEIHDARIADSLPTEVSLIFQKDTTQRLYLYELALERIVRFFHLTLGPDRVARVLARYNENHLIDGIFIVKNKISCREFNRRVLELKTPSEEFLRIFSGLAEILWVDLKKALGEEIASGVFAKAYGEIKNTYEAEMASHFLAVFPDGILENEKIAYLNRDELERKVHERTLELKREKESVEETIVERTGQLDAEKTKLDLIAEKMESGTILLDQSKHVLFANLAARRIIGLNEVPKDPGEILAAFLARFTTINLDDYYSKARPEAVFIVPDISTNDHIYKLSLDCLFDTMQNATGMLIWIEDITEEKELEKKKSDFISLVTHQLRTPLSGLKWTLRMLINGDLGPLSNEQKVFLMKSYEGNERMISLVDNILGINKIESEQHRYNYVTTKVLDLLDNVLYEISPVAARKRITIQVLNRNATLPMIMVDPEKMRAVLQNLLENAVKYTLEGGTISIEAEQAQDFVRVSIKDTGIGIPKAQQQNVFSQFFRAQNAADSVKQGSGLGLYIVKNIIDIHHGIIWFECPEGIGTTCFVTLPFVQVAEPAASVGW